MSDNYELRLQIGNRDTGILIRPDNRYQGMWRVWWPDGQVSPMGNLTRAKEAAVMFARARWSSWSTVAHWHRQQRAAVPPPAADLDLAATLVA